jgi:hypothetical protein
VPVATSALVAGLGRSEEIRRSLCHPETGPFTAAMLDADGGKLIEEALGLAQNRALWHTAAAAPDYRPRACASIQMAPSLHPDALQACQSLGPTGAAARSTCPSPGNLGDPLVPTSAITYSQAALQQHPLRAIAHPAVVRASFRFGLCLGQHISHLYVTGPRDCQSILPKEVVSWLEQPRSFARCLHFASVAGDHSHLTR